MLRLVSMIAALSLGAAAFAQAPTTSTAQQVQLLAPQLVAFSGSSANFESLVNGLTQGTPVTLATVGADGLVQIVTFLPATALSAADAARTLETARQSLIAHGIASPTAQQLAISLMGGTLPTPAGTTPVTGVVSGNAGATPIQLRNELAAAPSSATAATSLSASNLAALRAALTQGTPVSLTGATGPVTFTPPGRPMSGFEANQALQLASLLLAQQGILDPTPEQLRVALLGGNLLTASGSSVPVQGVLQGVRNTSDSRLFGTSNSPNIGTSNTLPTLSNPVASQTPAPAAPPAATTAPFGR